MGEVRGGGDKVDFLNAALAEMGEGKAISQADVPSYGCSVKYGS